MIGSVTVRSIGVVAACAAVTPIPAIASEGVGGGGSHKPEIQSISYSNAESGATLVEAGVKRAKKVSVAVGLGDNRERFELEKGKREAGVVFWSVEVPDRKDKCAVTVLKAKNRDGSDDRRTRVCTFGESDEEPSTDFPPTLP
jgi:hypothetical protein